MIKRTLLLILFLSLIIPSVISTKEICEVDGGACGSFLDDFLYKKEKITLPLIVVAGLVDGINPCAFAVLIFLLTFLLSISNRKKRMLKAGIVYIFAVYP